MKTSILGVDRRMAKERSEAKKNHVYKSKKVEKMKP
jgi:hypothetical protein